MRLSLIFLLLTLAACRERYGLPLEAAKNNLLVVEGNILNGDTTRIRLSRTSPIAERTLVAESGASLQIEGDDNSVVPLVESPTEPGTYSSPPLTLNNARQYRLRIYSGDKEYESAWLTVVNTAPIDSVFWQRDERDNGVEISVASRGSDADSRYYKWDYDEVWEFHAKYECTAYFTYVLMPNGTKEYRCLDVTHDGFTYNTCLEPWFYPPNGQRNDSMYTCWK